ncbi:phosphatase PAP2 family protein [Pseudoroseicyclus aestuarii]|uniref:Undecaprenyl-diphosphatase n=1 Tax=Pseudoroseicyclus aestuarii TaxID=1795041 RepID=A0A318SQ52_9RHOB|nr:phosphatase PAP2 family protein [Pseudoroseicyclus aestuarii]PYE83813.1 undecaprenyl-diphosphatase [Pseudoroseicyclus aestuarii]
MPIHLPPALKHRLATRVELRALPPLLIAAGGIWLFIALAGEIAEGETRGFDEMLLLALRTAGDPSNPIGGHRLQNAMRDITALGSGVVLVGAVVAVAGFLALARRGATALYLVMATGSGMAVSALAKRLVDRPRPDLVPHEVLVSSPSFPSGHSMSAAVVYLTLAVLLARALESRAQKAYVIALAALLAGAVGLSRVYLGVHWPTDVLAGWAGGAAWALGAASLAHWLGRRGRIEPDRDGTAD